MRRWEFNGLVNSFLFLLFLLFTSVLSMPAPVLANHTAAGAFVEDPALFGCNHCHNVTIVGGNANGINRRAAWSPANGGSFDPHARRDNWGGTVSFMLSKGSPATTAAVAYLNTWYNTTTTCPAGIPEGQSCATMQDTQPPSTPTNLTAQSSGTGTGILLSWTASTDNVGVTGYPLERCQGAGCSDFSQIASPTTNSYSDAGLTANTSYSYRVRATDAAGNLSGYSNTATAVSTIDTTPPSQPTNVTGTPDNSGTRVTLTWTASTDDTGVASYNIYRDLNSVPVGTTTIIVFTDQGLTPNTTYTYEVEAVDVAGNRSPKSSPIQVTTASGEQQPNQLWVARYNGPASQDDIGQRVVVDASGNVYMTGWSYNGVNFDYATVKFDSGGNQVWAARYDSGAGDFGHALAVDASGNVYVTGRSVTGGGNSTYDIVTIKYDSNGVQQWVNRYDRAGLDDIGLAIALDGAGNPIVAGIENNGTNTDAVTIKYDPANGNRQWVAEYNNGLADSGRDVTADSSGNVYLSGWSESATGMRDYLAIKYDSSGSQVWTARVNGTGNNQDIGQKVVLDATGNVYMTGWSYNGVNFDSLTVKFDSSGNQLWASRYDSGAGDFGHALAVDGSGNVYVTGRSVTGGGNSTYDIVTIKYNSSGVQQWMNRFDRAGMDDIGLAIVLDGAGNPIVAGIENNGTNTDAVNIKYDSATGNRQRVGNYDNGLADSGRDVTVDSSGNVYMSGWSQGSTSLRDYIVIKYASQSAITNGSTRARVQTGANVLIGGFIIEGPGPKTVLIRARGPSMSGAPFNIPGTLSDPMVDVYSGSTPIAHNDDWQVTDPLCGSPAISCGGAPEIATTGSDPCQPNPDQTSPPPNCALESAILITLPPGPYTAIVRGVNNTTGIGLVEIFDVDTTSSSTLINVSGRARVETSTGVARVIGGLIIRGNSPKTVLITGRGPSMSGEPFNLPGTLSNPTIQLLSKSTEGNWSVIARNDDWQVTDPLCGSPAISCGGATEIAATGLDPCRFNPGQTTPPPGCAQESAILITLPPGTYSAFMDGVNNDTGIGLLGIVDVSP